MMIHSRKPFPLAAMEPVTPVEVCVADCRYCITHALQSVEGSMSKGSNTEIS